MQRHSPRHSPRRVGAGALKEQLTELRQESAVLLELQNRLDKSIGLLKAHKKNVAGGSSSSGGPSQRFDPLEGGLVELQFINNLSEDTGGLRFTPEQRQRGAPSTGAMGTFTPLNQKRQLFEYEAVQEAPYTAPYTSQATLNPMVGAPYPATGGLHTADTYSRSRREREYAAYATVDALEDDLTTRGEYQQKIYTTTLELESATNRMAKQELEIYNLKQQCKTLQGIVATNGAGGTQRTGGKGKASSPNTWSTTTPRPGAAAATGEANKSDFGNANDSVLASDSKILERWGFDKNTSFHSSPPLKRSSPPPRYGSSSPLSRPSPFKASISSMPNLRDPFVMDGQGRPLSPSLHTQSPFVSNSREGRGGRSPQERFLQSEIIKRDREINAMSSALDDLNSRVDTTDPFNVLNNKPSKSKREELLELEMQKKDEVISAMSSTIDQLIEKSHDVESNDRKRSHREQTLELEVKKKEEEVQALTSALDQVFMDPSRQHQQYESSGGLMNSMNPEREQELQEQIRIKQEELQSLTSTLNQGMTSAPSPSGFKSPLGPSAAIRSPRATTSWTDVGVGVDDVSQWNNTGNATTPFTPNPNDPFAEIRLATQKLQDAKGTLQKSIGKPMSMSSRTAPRATAAGRGAPKSKPKMYYI